MASFFEPDSFLLDPTSYNELPSSFLSFSSFADFTSPLSPSSAFDLSSWDYGFSSKLLDRQSSKQHHKDDHSSQPSSIGGSDTSSPRDPFSVIETAFEPATPAENIGIFHTPATAGPSKLSGHSDRHSSGQSFRSSSSSETWEDPVTPGLTSKSSIESIASTSTLYTQQQPQYQPYSWDEASTSLGGSSQYQQQYTAHRTTSNPVLNPNRPRVPRPIASMPALREEDSMNPASWYDVSEPAGLLDQSTGSTSQQMHAGGVLSLDGDDNLLAEDFDWVFGYGLSPPDQMDPNVYTGFEERLAAATDRDTIQQSQPPQHWLPTPAQDAESFSFPAYDVSTIADMPSFCIDPATLMTSNAVVEEEQSRPSSAPGLNTNEPVAAMLSVPQPGTMTRR